MSSAGPGFVHLNRDDAWRDFTRRGLDVVDGRLRLAALPAATGPGPSVAGDPPDSPSGLAVDGDGTVSYTDSGSDTVVQIDGCDGAQRPVPCVGGTGEDPTRLRDPGGLAVHPGRSALLVADTGNHRVQVFDLRTHQLLDVWGDPGPGLPPAPGAAPGRFAGPCDLDVDPTGLVYVVDRGNRRVQQFTAGGEVVPGFAAQLAAEAVLVDPVGVVVVVARRRPVACVLDRARRVLVVVDPDGHLLAEHDLEVDGDPLGLVVTPDAVYVGESGAGGAVVRLRWDGTRVGTAAGYTGPVAALALDGVGGLLAHPGGSGPPVRLALDTAFVRGGIAWGGPFGGFSAASKNWHRLVAAMATLPADAHVRFFVHTTDSAAGRPVVEEESAADPFPAPTWTPGPPDLGEFLVGRPPARLAWVGIHLTGEGTSSASVEQVRLEFDRPGYLPHLPALYHDDRAGAFLPRYLALAESLFDELEDTTAGLARLLDPAAAPVPFLAELARWLAVDPICRDTAQLRAAVAEAYAASARRGTVAGLRDALRRDTGVDAWIDEPIVVAAWWALAADEASPAAEQDTSVLGVSTVLAAAEPQGAVLGSTATVDRAHLIENAEFGMPLFDAVAHRFTVRIYQGATYSTERVAAVEALLGRERPAHTEFQVCRVDPGIAIGVGGRVGIDTVVGGDPAPARLDDGAALADGFVLGGTPPGRVGQAGGIGVTTLLGSASVQDQ